MQQLVIAAWSLPLVALLAEGIIWWATTLDPPPDPARDRSFDPLGKPAERQIRKCGPPPLR